MYHIPGVLSPQDVARFREQLEQAEWVDGRVTTGAQGAQVKNNQQVDTRSTLYAALQNEVLNAVNQLLFSLHEPSGYLPFLSDQEVLPAHVGRTVPVLKEPDPRILDGSLPQE